MPYALGALGKGGGGHGGHRGGGFRGGHRGGGRGWGRGWGWRGGWWGGWTSPGFVDYYSYSRCDECMWAPPALYLRCLSYYGCPVPAPALLGLGQETNPARMGIGALVVGAGIAWWLTSRRKKGS